MKTLTRMTILTLAGALVGACGRYEKNPVENLDQLRENGRQEIERGPEKPQVITEYVERPTPPQVVEKESATVNESYLVITPDLEMTYIEGQAATFFVRARSLVPGVKIKLTAQNLPEGAVLRDVSNDETVNPKKEKDLYGLTWTAPLYTVPGNQAVKTIRVKFTAQVSEVPAGQDKKTLEGLVREKESVLLIVRNQEAPSDLKIENLPAEVAEGSVTKFQVTVKIPGIDGKTSQKPRLVLSYDGVSMTPGNNYLELDGSRHVVADVNQKEPQYAGDSRWKFSLVFDTKNVSVQPQLAPNGSVLPNADGTRVRLSFKAYSPYGASTPELLKQLKIGLTRPVAAPRFDLSGLGQEVLELTPGEKVKLSFFVASADSTSQVKVELPDLKTLPGGPTLKCAAAGSAKQDCQLEWAVPCTAADRDLTQEIRMSATATVGGRNSEPVQQTLKTVRSKKEKVNCTNPAGAADQKKETGK